MRIAMLGSGFTLLLLGAAATSAFAADPVKPVAPPAVAPQPAYVVGFGQSVSGDALATQRGGTNVNENMNLNGSVDHNSADNVSSGYNAIGGGAFNGAAGMPTVIQNSGNNVLIQNATIVNVQFKP